MSKRYIVTITDTKGIIWLNTGSFKVSERLFAHFLYNIQAIIDIFRWKKNAN